MITQQHKQLFTQGLSDYGDALNAIRAFRSMVQGICRRVVEANLANYGTALGIEVPKKLVADYKWSDGSMFELGVRYVHKGAALAEFGHTVCWERGERGAVEAWTLMWVWARRKNLQHLRGSLREKKIHHDTQEDDTVIWLGEDFAAKDIGRIDRKLDALMQKWIQFWRKAGGIKALGGKA